MGIGINEARANVAEIIDLFIPVPIPTPINIVSPEKSVEFKPIT